MGGSADLAPSNKSDMKKRYQMYADAALKLTKKVESKKGERM